MTQKYKKKITKKDLDIGQKIGNFTILEEAPKVSGWKVNLWKCQCNCGEIRTYSTTQLRHATSCGCLKKARMSKPRTDKEVKINNKLKSSVFCQYSRGARNRDLEFLLSRELVEKLSQSNCYYCGSAPTNKVKFNGREYTYNGIDRVDNTKGYVEGNVVSCCKHCNHFKGERTFEEFKENAINLYNNLENVFK